MEINSRNINILLKVDQSFIPKAEYVFRTFCRIIGLKPRFFYNFSFENMHVVYSSNVIEEAPIHIFHNHDAVNFYKERDFYPSSKVNKRLFKKEYIPFLFSQKGDIFLASKAKVNIRKDIISSAFYFLSCWQEYVMMDQDFSDRFSFFDSLQFQNDFADIPIVDRYCEIFQRAIVLLMPEYTTERIWGNQYNFALSVSHDIDYWEFWSDEHIEETKQYNLNRVKSRKFFNAMYKLIFHYIDKRLLRNSTKKMSLKLLEKEKALGIESTNFFLTHQNFEDKRNNYFANENIRNDIQRIFKDKQIGLHSSQIAAKSLDKLLEEQNSLRTLGQHFKGNRVHYLYMNYQSTFSILESAGFSYDATLSYWENYGFRAGISYPFYPFNLESNRPYHFLEIPLTVMDASLYSKNAMAFSTGEAWSRLKLMIDFSIQHQSHISFLWHNTTFDPVDYPGWGKLYWKAVKYAQKKGGWVTSLDEIFKFWIER